jgi:hypothetical protein
MHVNFKLVSSLAVAALLLGASSASAQGILAQTQSNSAWGGLYGRDAARSVDIYVSRAVDVNGNPSTFLFFEVEVAVPGSQSGWMNVMFGSGIIPDADMTSDGLGQLLLDTDTASNGSFQTFACSDPLDPSTWGRVANPGRVQMTASRTAVTPILRTSGEWTFLWGDTLITQVGNGQFGSAAGTGSVGSIALPAGATGGIGMNQSVDVVIQQGQ